MEVCEREPRSHPGTLGKHEKESTPICRRPARSHRRSVLGEDKRDVFSCETLRLPRIFRQITQKILFLMRSASLRAGPRQHGVGSLVVYPPLTLGAWYALAGRGGLFSSVPRSGTGSLWAAVFSLLFGSLAGPAGNRGTEGHAGCFLISTPRPSRIVRPWNGPVKPLVRSCRLSCRRRASQRPKCWRCRLCPSPGPHPQS